MKGKNHKRIYASSTVLPPFVCVSYRARSASWTSVAVLSIDESGMLAIPMLRVICSEISGNA